MIAQSSGSTLCRIEALRPGPAGGRRPETGLAETGLAETWLAETWLAEIWLAEIRLAEI